MSPSSTNIHPKLLKYSTSKPEPTILPLSICNIPTFPSVKIQIQNLNPKSKILPKSKNPHIIRRIFLLLQTEIVFVQNLHLFLNQTLDLHISQIVHILVTRRKLRIRHQIIRPGLHREARTRLVRQHIQLVHLMRN